MQITIQNYFQIIGRVDLTKLPQPFPEMHDYTLQASTNGTDWTPYATNDGIREVVNLYFQKLGDYLDKHGSVRPASAKVHTPKKAVPEPPIADTVTKLEHIHEEVKFIKRFAALHTRVKSPNAILNFIKALQRAIVQKYITKKSQYASEIRMIQERLIQCYNKMKGDTQITIDSEFLARLVTIAGGESVYTSIGFIKRYIGMQGKVVEKKKIDGFVKQISNAIDKKKLVNDPYEDRVNTILSALQKQAKTKPVSISETQLRGLEGIVTRCGSPNTDLGTIYRTKGKKLRQCNSKNYSDAKKGACSHHRGLSGVMSAQEVALRQYEMLSINGEWYSLIGRPEKNFVMMVHGEPGSGKTTFLLKFIKYLSNMGSVLYISSEEYDSATLTEKVQTYLNPRPSNVYFTSDIRNINGQFDTVVLDSVTDLGLDLENFKALKAKYPDTAFILVLQHTKDGQFKGGKEWEHEAQIAGKTDNGIIEIYKNRYGVKGTMNFFNQPYAIAA